MELREIVCNIFEVKINDPIELSKTFLRFQEYYESPKFRGEIFTLKEFKEWYKKENNTKTFTYYTDWAGFNFPRPALSPFYEGKFDPLSAREKKLLDLLKDTPNYSYIIGISDNTEVLNHEITHGLYCLNQEYHFSVNKYILENAKDFEPIFEHLKKMGYNQKVWVDEVNAYISCDYDWLKERLGFGIDEKHVNYLKSLREAAYLLRKGQLPASERV